MTTTDFYSTWSELAERTARYVSRDYPDVEQADLTQDLFVFILENDLTNPVSPGVAKLLSNQAKKQAAQYRAEHLIISPQYSYRTSDVRRILEHVFEHQDWVKSGSFTETADDGTAVPFDRSGREASYSLDDTLVEHSDVKRAWERLSFDYRKALFVRFALGTEPDRGGAEERKMYRALARLTDNLNSYYPRRSHDGPGSRRIPSRALAQYLISEDYSPSSVSPGRSG